MTRDEQIREFIKRGQEAQIAVDKILKEQPRKTHQLPRECPEGGEHHWNSHCSKCDMRISYSPDCQEKIYKKAGQEIPNQLKMES